MLYFFYMMSGSKAPDFDAYGLFRATHSHNPTPVSYTHLDVYKRQVMGLIVNCLFMYVFYPF